MTRRQAVAHAKQFTVYWIIPGIIAQLNRIASMFPDLAPACQDLFGKVVVLQQQVRKYIGENVNPIVKVDK